MIQENLGHLWLRINDVCRRLERDPKDITLVCVTKDRNIAELQEALRVGITDIGENRVQEAHEKFGALTGFNQIRWHLIGHLQTNKVRQALRIFNLIHSVDSLRLAEAINTESAHLKKTTDILIQVNTSREKTKFGLGLNEVAAVIDTINALENIRIRGLMTIAPFVDEIEQVRPCFRQLRLLSEEISRRFNGRERVTMEYLSMGMTQDFETALEEGSNMLRIGRAIFDDV